MPTPSDGLTIPLPPGATPQPPRLPWRPKSLSETRSERSRWQAIRHLLLEQWEPPPRDERPLRWIAGTFSLLLNLLFAILLIYFLVLQYLAMHRADDQEQQAIMVEFIGRGKPQVGGGDSTPSTATVSSSKASSSAAAASASASASASVVSKPTPATASEPPTAQPAPVPTPAPNVTLSKPVEDVSPFQVPVAAAPQASASSRALAVQSRQLSERSVADPLQAPDLRPVASPQRTVSESLAVRPSATFSERSVRDPSSAATSAATVTAVSAASASTSATRSSTASNASTARGTSNTPSPTAGPRPAAQTGGWYQNATANDWGNSNRERPGQKQGARDGQAGLQGNDLFDEQGKPKLPYNGSASRNDPPGLVNGEVRDLDRVGTWRKRRPTDANLPGSNMVWLPHETLLDEWVRRGVKEVRVRIPGTTTTVRCKVSVLALGGACGLTDPNLEDQEAIARPPPSVPFKPELNQHNGGRREGQKVEDFGPGAIMPGQAIKPVGKDDLPPSPQFKKPTFKFGDEK